MNRVILTVVDRFSKAATSRSPLCKPTLLVHHVFRLRRIPRDIISNWGQQFTSRVWRAFCAAPGVTVWCVAARHPAAWCAHLPWVEYALSSQVSMAMDPGLPVPSARLPGKGSGSPSGLGVSPPLSGSLTPGTYGPFSVFSPGAAEGQQKPDTSPSLPPWVAGVAQPPGTCHCMPLPGSLLHGLWAH